MKWAKTSPAVLLSCVIAALGAALALSCYAFIRMLLTQENSWDEIISSVGVLAAISGVIFNIWYTHLKDRERVFIIVGFQDETFDRALFFKIENRSRHSVYIDRVIPLHKEEWLPHPLNHLESSELDEAKKHRGELKGGDSIYGRYQYLCPLAAARYGVTGIQVELQTGDPIVQDCKELREGVSRYDFCRKYGKMDCIDKELGFWVKSCQKDYDNRHRESVGDDWP